MAAERDEGHVERYRETFGQYTGTMGLMSMIPHTSNVMTDTTNTCMSFTNFEDDQSVAITGQEFHGDAAIDWKFDTSPCFHDDPVSTGTDQHSVLYSTDQKNDIDINEVTKEECEIHGGIQLVCEFATVDARSHWMTSPVILGDPASSNIVNIHGDQDSDSEWGHGRELGTCLNDAGN